MSAEENWDDPKVPYCPHGKVRLMKDDFYTGQGCEECMFVKHKEYMENRGPLSDCQGEQLVRCHTCHDDHNLNEDCPKGARNTYTPNGARKDDQGKPPVTRGCLHYFPLALAEVAKISAVGAKKYAWDGWRGVPDWEHRYPDALGRHLLATKGELRATDPETGELEWAHIAWNALAVIEKILADDAANDAEAS